MRITTGGNVSIGTASNEARLDVRGSANAVSIQAHNTATSGINTTVLVAQCDQDTSNSSYLLFQCRNGGGLVMKVLQPKIAGKADGGVVSSLVKAALSQ